jgi:hypothetical protein
LLAAAAGGLFVLPVEPITFMQVLGQTNRPTATGSATHHSSYMAPLPTRARPSLGLDRPEIRQLARLLKHKPLTLRDYYAIGEQPRLLSEEPALAFRGSGWRAEAARLVGQSEAALNKCLQFRNSYAEDELAEVERLDPGWAYLTIALAVKDVRKRHKPLRHAREEGWNTRELQRAVQRLRGSRGAGADTAARRGQRACWATSVT